MKKIIFYYSSMLPSGGVERVISNLANSLSGNFDITVLTKDAPGSIPFYSLNSNIKFETIHAPHNFNMNNRFFRTFQAFFNLPKSIYLMNQYLKNKDYDFIYTASPMGTFEVLVSSKLKGDKIVASEHAADGAYNFIYEMFKKICYPRVKKLSVPTKMDFEIYMSRGYDAIYIPHQTTFKFHPSQVKNKKNIVLNVGRLTNDKRQLLLLQIWKELYCENKISNWILEIVGEGELESDIRKYIFENKLEKVVKFNGAVKNISEKYNSSKIFAFTSKTEGFGMVLLEAMSFSLPCLSFDIPAGPRDIISDGVNGHLIKEGDLLDYKNKLLNLMNDEDKRKMMENGAGNTVINWPNEEILHKWLEVFGG